LTASGVIGAAPAETAKIGKRFRSAAPLRGSRPLRARPETTRETLRRAKKVVVDVERRPHEKRVPGGLRDVKML
jgi:UTP:GlnB (protein PII) uridylyltransferase